MDTGSSQSLLAHVLLPVANVDDARQSASALAPYEPASVTTLHVVEKGEGVPDKTPVWVSEEVAEEAFEAVKLIIPHADAHTVYGRDVVAEILTAARDLEVSSIALRSRGGGRLVRFLSGDLSFKLLQQVDRPVVVLPTVEDDP